MRNLDSRQRVRSRLLFAATLLVIQLASVASGKQGEGLSESSVRAAMRPYMQAMRECVIRQHELDQSVGGSMHLSFTIGNRGRITKVRVLSEEHTKTYVAGCANGVLRSMKFPAFSGRPVLVPRFPIAVGGAGEGMAPPDEDDEEKTQPVREAPRKIRAQVLRRLKTAVRTMKACVRDHGEKSKKSKKKKKKRRKKKKRKKQKLGPLTITLTLNPLGRATGVEVLGKAHRKNYVAGCVAGVLAFVEFPSLGSDTLTFSRIKLPRL